MKVCFGAASVFTLCALATTAAAQSEAQPNKATTEHVYKAGEVTKRAAILDRPEPLFTEEARRHDVEGTVRVRMVLNADGTVTNVAAVTELPDGLTEKALKAARRIKFIPAEKDGRKVSIYVTIDYNFTIYYDEKEKVERQAVILEQPAPEYTEEARQHNVSGTVVLRVGLRRSGEVEVSSVDVVKGLPYGLTEKAIEAARKIKFTPAEDRGHPVSQLRTIEYHFPPK
jgi:TonB family protein